MAPTKRAGKAKNALLGGGGASMSAGGQSKVKKADWSETFTRKKTAGVSDMTLLSTISNDSINDNLRKRFENAEIYTYIGHVLISVNPFRLLPIYDDATLKSYRNKNRLEMPPHVYAIAESMYYQMVSYHENQCVIISGESGAGKTEAAKRIMQYIAEVSASKDASSAGIGQIRDIILATNPLLESFGCAKTLRNNNSSRHGKYLEIEFDGQGSPVGAIITNYLLEKGRVVGQIKNERNFHIFYQLTKGASPQQQEAYGLQGPSAYAYTSKANCLDVDGIDDVADWHETLRAMQTIGLNQQEIDSILRMLALILWLGNVTFKADQEGNSAIADPSVPDFVAYLLEAPGGSAAVIKALTLRTVETQRGGRRGSVYEVPMNPTQAASARDALAKAIYNNLFEWIVDRVNISLKSKSAAAHVIGILDIYGFEIFDNNSFEQLCINYVNEKLQQIFIQLTLKTEQEEYVREQIKWTPIDYFNNKIVCDLIEEKRPPGVFAALNDACATAHADPTAADNSFVQRLSMLGSNPHFDGRGDKFLIRHYAGDVMYNVAGVTDKNKDVLGNDMLNLVATSNNHFLQTLFPERPDPNSKKRPPTASDRIKASANALVEKLMRSQPSYIRTIKPNQNKSPTEFDTKAILHQIKYLGLQENIRVRRAGFAYRNTFEKMVERFYLLSPATSYAGDYIWQGDAKSGCAKILQDTGIAREEWQMGITKAFIKNPETLFALEAMRDKYWHNMAARIQRAFRNYIRYKQECASRIQRFWKNKKQGIAYVQLRDYGHQVLGGRKERRRFSLVSMRQFRGDYLGVGGNTPQGELLRNACNLSPSEPIVFSMTIQLLVSKLGRSSTRSPRYLVLAGRTVFILITQVIQNRPQTTVERRIPIATIRSVQTSTLRDDWLTLNVQASEEADPLFSCVFKTELVTHLLQQSNNAISLTVAPQIQYQKKKGKMAPIKFVKDENVPRDDVYKSQTVSVASGDPASSVSWPPAARKAGVAKPIGQGKLLRPGGPSSSNASRPKPAPKPTPAARPLPASAMTAPAAPAAASSRLPAAPPALAAAIPRAPPAPGAAAAARAAPPPPKPAAPPAPPAPPAVPQYKALYAFDTSEDGEMSLVKGEVVELVQKETNGWYLVRKGGKEGWTPTDYLQEIVPEKPKPRLAPPPPKPNGSLSNGNTPTASGRTTPTPGPKPVIGAKPTIGAKPAAPRPPAVASNGIPAAPPAPNGAAAGGQMNLAQALAKRLQQQQQG